MKTFYDPWNGDGVYHAWKIGTGWLLIALRWRWHLRFTRPPAKPGVWRLYIGPLEIERSVNPHPQPG